MTEDEQELKEKIVEILKKEIEYVVVCGSSVKNVCVDHIADALIASGYVVDLPALIDGKMGIFVPDKGYMELYPVSIKEQLAGANHRAEVMERALDKATELAYTYRTQDDTLSCSSCPFDGIFDKCKERGLYEDCSKRWKEELLQQAERELAEEGKND